MNQEIRLKLIEAAKTNKPIYYGEIARILGLSTQNQLDLNELSRVLGEISSFEYKDNRPLLSAMAIYSPNSRVNEKSIHGRGFYKICEELGVANGKNAYELEKNEYGVSEIMKCHNYWKGKVVYDSNFRLPFFNQKEVDFFSEWIGKLYDKNNHDHIQAKDYLLNTVWSKTAYWSDEVIKRLSGFDNKKRRMWQSPAGRGKGYKFKPYTWARLFRNGDGKKDIFFTVGIEGDSKSLVYKLDYFFESASNLNAEQKKICQDYLPKQEERWQVIPYEEIENISWSELINRTIEHIKDNVKLYDQLVELVWNKKEPQEVFRDTLYKKPKPVPKEKTQPKPRTFKGNSTTKDDYIDDYVSNLELGELGEALVIEHEREKLRRLELLELVEKVKKVKDGCGYDILSYDEQSQPIFIEVKNTMGGAKTPFFISSNEKEFAETYSDKYRMYRLFYY